jgi:hypothetical protein
MTNTVAVIMILLGLSMIISATIIQIKTRKQVRRRLKSMSNHPAFTYYATGGNVFSEVTIEGVSVKRNLND